MLVAQVGNFAAPHSTENELRRACEALGHEVTTYQENDPGAFVRVAQNVERYDVVLWTRTGWEPPVPHDQQRLMLAAAHNAGVPTVGYHLDRWWGLSREHQVHTEPFFTVSHLFTADGGHQAEWESVGVNHAWLPPGVSEFECGGGTFRDEYASDVAFVGSWRPGYHREWKHRGQLVEFLRRNYRDRVRFWPPVGQPAVRGEALRDLYASVKVLVGDSCLAGDARAYLSDRLPESLGRGGFLVHPRVRGVTDGLYTEGEHLACWTLLDWAGLRATVDHYLDDDAERQRIAAAGRAHVLANFTYTRLVERALAVAVGEPATT